MLLTDIIFVVSILMVCIGVIGYAYYDMFKQLKRLGQVEKESCEREEE